MRLLHFIRNDVSTISCGELSQIKLNKKVRSFISNNQNKMFSPGYKMLSRQNNTPEFFAAFIAKEIKCLVGN
jgi:hypothetical protein